MLCVERQIMSKERQAKQVSLVVASKYECTKMHAMHALRMARAELLFKMSKARSETAQRARMCGLCEPCEASRTKYER